MVGWTFWPDQVRSKKMVRKLKALYSGKALIPQEPCDIPEGSVVELILQGSPVLPPEIRDPVERARILSSVVERMQRNCLTAPPQRLTREELHERD